MATSDQPRENGHLEITTSSLSRLHRQRKHLEFTIACEQRKLIPAFCKVSYKTIKNNKMRSHEVRKFESRRLSDAIKENKEKLLKLEYNFESSKNLLFKFSKNPTHFNFILQNVRKSVFKAAHTSDRKRDLKLSKLSKKSNPNFNKAKVINDTGIIIPPEVLSLLQMGSEFALGGSSRNDNSDTYLELNDLFKKFRTDARNANVKEIDIEHIRSYISLCGKDVSKCYTKDDRISNFFKFKKDNPSILVLGVDKTSDIIILEKNKYHKKLGDLFENPEKFEKIENFNLQDQLKAYRQILTNSIEHCLGTTHKYLIQPVNSISSLYGVVKCHKENWPLRPISTGYSSITAGHLH